MRLLLDTHAFLWFVLADARLSAAARTAVGDPANEIEISPATYWEVAIKVARKKYALTQPYQVFFETQIAVNRFRVLPIEIRHTAGLVSLPHHHKDPFDRLLIAQAMVEDIPVVSNDPQFDAYPVTRIW
jgi:PIN domain nuclease of toxin-antitoxin system